VNLVTSGSLTANAELKAWCTLSTEPSRHLLDLGACQAYSESHPAPDNLGRASVFRGISITKVVDAHHRGTSIDAELDETILVRLDETPTTGYRWALDQIDEHVLAAQGSEFQLPANPAIGAAGQRTFAFKAINRGVGRIALALRRKWEHQGTPADQFEVSVRVGERG
jgi:inhibitor of cysteine peptidase